jgi:hypothetical protein
VTDNVNQSKGDKDPAEWMPPLSSAHCRYLGEWAAVKTRWGLTVDSAEKSTLTSRAGSCSNVTITVQTVLGGGGGTTPPPSSCGGSNSANVTIPDTGASVSSAITVAGCSRPASPSSAVEVHIVHTYRGDLVVTLVAPDGSSYTLKGSSSSDSAPNVHATFAVNLSSETAGGNWQLRVRDVYSGDTGYLDSWTLSL